MSVSESNLQFTVNPRIFICKKHGQVDEKDVEGDDSDEQLEKLFHDLNLASERLGTNILNNILSSFVQAKLIARFRLDRFKEGSRILETLQYINHSNRTGEEISKLIVSGLQRVFKLLEFLELGPLVDIIEKSSVFKLFQSFNEHGN